MPTLPKRNIGVTGFMSVEELKTAQDLFIRLFEQHEAAHEKENSEPRLMAGILVSSKTIEGIPDRYPGRYPKPQKLTDLFLEANSWNTRNLAHYNTDTPENLVEECEQVMEVVGPSLDGFQLNIRWPDPVLVKELRRRHPRLHILLQVGGGALSHFARGREGAFSRYDTEGFMAKVLEYGGSLNEILLDPSGGRGEALQAGHLTPLVRELMKVEGLGIGVAGGLSGETMGLVSELVPVCSYLSIDAEGRLRNSEDDSLNLERVEVYLKAAFELFYPKEK
jgi:hypothetical protein